MDDFNFEVICHPFPDSNIHSSLDYSTFYSQLIRFHRLCNNKSDFLFRAKLIYQTLINRGYKFNLLLKSFVSFIKKYPMAIKYESRGNLFLQMLYFDNYVVCNINNGDVYKIVTTCFAKIENIAMLPLLKQNKPIVPLQQLILPAAFGSVDEPLASCMIVHFSAHILKWELECKFGVRFHIFIIISCLGSRFHTCN